MLTDRIDFDRVPLLRSDNGWCIISSYVINATERKREKTRKCFVARKTDCSFEQVKVVQ